MSIISQQYEVDLLVRKHGLILPKPRDWWMITKLVFGSINGLEKTFSGKVVATNGIMVLIINNADQCLFGHKDSLNVDEDKSEDVEADDFRHPLGGAATPSRKSKNRPPTKKEIGRAAMFAEF